MRREKSSVPIPVPSEMSNDVKGYKWARNTVGESGCAVYRLHGNLSSPDLYLKLGENQFAEDLAGEAERLEWLANYLPVPQVLRFLRLAEKSWLLMAAVPGKTAYQLLDSFPAQRHAVVDALAVFLRRMHAIPLGACPFRSDHALRLADARARIDAGLVDEDDFDDERAGWTAEQVWDGVQQRLPLAPDPVVSHGDYSLDNLFVHDGEVIACIDAGRVGVADRYQDLAIMWHCLGEFGEALQRRFLAQYGMAQPDQDKLTFHLLLDELF